MAVVVVVVFVLSKKQWGRFHPNGRNTTPAGPADTGVGVIEEGQRALPTS